MYQSFDLTQLRHNNPNFMPKIPFEHQREAFAHLSKVFTFDGGGHKSGMLVLPTGAGKTFTSVNWICRNVLPRNIKVVWLAHTSHLLEQAYKTFTENLLETHRRECINMRIVSSNPMHAKPYSIELTDDIVVITTQTAIRNWNSSALDGNGNKRVTAFEHYIHHAKDTGLFVVLDEAHHAPAYGCRNLLVGGSQGKVGIREVMPTVCFLGLTATPTYNDERRRGWLFEIFNTDMFAKKGIIYEADKADLTKQGILAVPNYIQKNTGKEFEVDDRVYNHVVREHRDLPEDLVEKLAKDSGRNDYIVNDYLQNKDAYGKTLIFADRWVQCVYMKEKLKAKGIRADAVYTHIDATPNSAEQRNKRTPAENALILEKFRNNELDVLINIKMLTEGTDVPNVNTVFITRQTTSSILFTQMIGRALRGKKAGGGQAKDVAHIVLFADNWKRLLNFVTPGAGEMDTQEAKVRGHYPLQYIAIKLVEDLSRKIDSGLVFADRPFLEQIPVGWYETDVLITVEDETNAFKEFVIVYDHTQTKFAKFIQEISQKLGSEWEDENLDLAVVQPQVEEWLAIYFDGERDDVNKTLDLDVIRIARHMAQSGKAPAFCTFEERNKHDLSQIAFNAVQQRMDDLTLDELLMQEFHGPDKLWQLFYKDYIRFSTAFDAERRRAIHRIKYSSEPVMDIQPSEVIDTKRELTEQEKVQVFVRDNYTCLCCGKTKTKGKRVRLEVDHIIPVNFGGLTTIENSQTLCRTCNQAKGINEINFRVYKTPLSSSKACLELFDLSKSEYMEWMLQRIVNFFYHCQAVSSLKIDDRPRSKHRRHWEIHLYPGNHPEWLQAHKDELINFIHTTWGYALLEELTIR
ncbi:MAG: DEAD/DEAH box helicase family protein [Anaerolineae bacterium]|nr:DEAD/DEAH box helicase family protein [Anaerolineae bacterium]